MPVPKTDEQRILFQDGSFKAYVEPGTNLDEIQWKDPETGEKANFSIGEVASMLKIKESTIRYYEKEFPQLTPQKTNSGRRQFNKDDFDIIKKIIELKNEGLKLATIRTRLEDYLSKEANTTTDEAQSDTSSYSPATQPKPGIEAQGNSEANNQSTAPNPDESPHEKIPHQEKRFIIHELKAIRTLLAKLD